jgi:small subunit ribosomal protein S17
MPRRVLQGTVRSTANDKTVVVEVERRFRHPLYGKFVKQNKKYKAHDEDNKYKVGDIVAIEEHRPLSKVWLASLRTKTSRLRSKVTLGSFEVVFLGMRQSGPVTKLWGIAPTAG